MVVVVVRRWQQICSYHFFSNPIILSDHKGLHTHASTYVNARTCEAIRCHPNPHTNTQNTLLTRSTQSRFTRQTTTCWTKKYINKTKRDYRRACFLWPRDVCANTQRIESTREAIIWEYMYWLWAQRANWVCVRCVWDLVFIWRRISIISVVRPCARRDQPPQQHIYTYITKFYVYRVNILQLETIPLGSEGEWCVVLYVCTRPTTTMWCVFDIIIYIAHDISTRYSFFRYIFTIRSAI